MQVQNWMNPEVVTADESSSIVRVMELLEAHDISHLPVTKAGKLVGIITEQDVKAALPSKSTALTAQELHYFLAEMKARDIMKADPQTIRPGETVELAAVKMLEHEVSGLPVVTDKGELVGMITQRDVLRVLISITGIYQGGVQFAFNLADRPGSIKEVANIIRDEGGQIVSILSSSDSADEGYRHVFIRIHKLPEESLQRLTRRLEQDFMLLYMVKDPLKKI